MNFKVTLIKTIISVLLAAIISLGLSYEVFGGNKVNISQFIFIFVIVFVITYLPWSLIQKKK